MIDVESSRTNDAGLTAIADGDIEAVYELEVYTITCPYPRSPELLFMSVIVQCACVLT